MFGFWFLDPDLNFSSLTARLVASVIAVIFFLPFREIAHVWLSHIFSGIKFNTKSYPLFDFFDPLGALFMLLCGYGWAKKIPYFVTEPGSRSEYIFICLAGPAFTFFSSVVLGIIFNAIVLLSIYGIRLAWIASVVGFLIEINVVLTVINLIPIPPLDGFKICESFIPSRYMSKYQKNYFLISVVLSIMFILGFFDIPLTIMMLTVRRFVDMLAGLPFVWLKG